MKGSGDRHTICVNKNALPAHLSHGDWAGPCQDCPQSLVAPPEKSQNAIHTQKNNPELTLFPNPAREQAQLTFVLEEDMDIRLELFGANGQTMRRQTFTSQQGINTILLDLQELPAGRLLGPFVTGTGYLF
ncbi:MAG: T9SS type A sorting domain-containing protein [Saprospirales bacterium]|nr:T9SS type A sorting domain-containing protein [Saprospirales bacterium]